MEAPHQAYARWLARANPELYQRLLADPRSVKHVPHEWHLTRWAADRTIDFLETRDRGRPCFRNDDVFEPHDPYDGYPMGMVKRDRREQDTHADCLGRPARARRPQARAQAQLCRGLRTVSSGDLRGIRRDYHASVAHVDLEIGRVLERLGTLGLAENTLVIFTSDHGDQLGDHGHLVKGAGLSMNPLSACRS